MSKHSSRARFHTKPPQATSTTVLIAKGVLLSVVVSFFCTLLLSFISLMTDNTYIDHYIQYIMVGVTMVSIFIGSIYATKKAEAKGLIIGVVIGLIYVLISVGLGMEISQEDVPLLLLTNKFVAGILAGILGGLIGVNL